jgi:hypothetical protein
MSGASISAVAMAGCSGTDPVAAWTAFIDQVSAIVAKGCGIVSGFVPTANTILAIVNVLFPGVGTAVVTIANSVESVASAICSSVTPTPKLAAAIEAATPLVPVHIGDVTINGKTVTVIGYNAKYGPSPTSLAELKAMGLVK